jgi:hypothetical protein
VKTKYDQVAPFVQKIVNSKTEKDQQSAIDGMLGMLTQNARPESGHRGTGAGKRQELSGVGRGGPSKSGGNHVAGMSLKGKQIGPDMIQPVRDEGGFIGHANINCSLVPATSSLISRTRCYSASQRRWRCERSQLLLW